MESSSARVLLIDDDADVRDAVGRLLRSAGWSTQVFASGEEFRDAPPVEGSGCVVLDLSMPGMSGFDVHEWMLQSGITWPVIYLSANCDVRCSVRAMKQGAVDVLEKPAEAELLLQAISKATDAHAEQCLQQQARKEFERRLSSLSPREREVMDQVTLGRLNKQIAGELGISLKTVKVHRGRAMAKMHVRSVAALVHQCDQFGPDTDASKTKPGGP